MSLERTSMLPMTTSHSNSGIALALDQLPGVVRQYPPQRRGSLRIGGAPSEGLDDLAAAGLDAAPEAQALQPLRGLVRHPKDLQHLVADPVQGGPYAVLMA